MGNPRVADGRRWGVLWVPHEVEELRVHYRATIPEMTARHVVVNLLASGQVARMNAGWLVTRPSGSGPTLQRFWGTVCQDGEAAYVVLFLNDRCLLLPSRHDSRHDKAFTSTYDAVRTYKALAGQADWRWALSGGAAARWTTPRPRRP